MSTLVSARYAGTCRVCHDRYPQGTLIQRSFTGWAHAECVAAEHYHANRRAEANDSNFGDGTAPPVRQPSRRHPDGCKCSVCRVWTDEETFVPLVRSEVRA